MNISFQYMFALQNKRSLPGFTLVELIVVITILAILGTIGFISIQGYSSSARDSSRISNLVNLHKGLTIFQTVGWNYPMPENPITLTASGAPIGYQGFAKDQIGNIAKLSAGSTKDPLDPTIYTTYSTNALQTKMQLMNFLEDGSKVTALLATTTNAATNTSYATRSPMTKWDTLGILLGTGTTLNQPVQELLTATFTGIDVVSTSTGYTAVFSKTDTISGTGSSLLVVKASMTIPTTLNSRDTSLIGYWDMETLTADGKIADLSGNGNGGTTLGTIKFWSWFVYDDSTYVVNSRAASVDTPLQMNFSQSSYTFSAKVSINTSYVQCIFASPIVNLCINPKLTYFDYTGSWRVTQAYDFSSIQSNVWFVFTYTTTPNGNTVLYVNGEKKWSANTWVFNNSPFTLRLMNYTNPFYGGGTKGSIEKMDEVRVYNRVLSDAEVLNLYNVTR